MIGEKILAKAIRVMSALILGAGLMSVTALPAAFGAYPDSPVEMTVLFGNGSSADLTARVLADGMAKRLGVAVPVVNRTGGGGALGYTHVKTQKPDGYSLVWNSNSVSTAYHQGTMPFDYKAFDAVARVSLEVPAFAVRSDTPWKTLKDFMDAAKKNSGKMKIGISGKGSFTHLASELMFAKVGVKVVYVPYVEGRATTELLGGRIDGALQWPSVFKSHADAGDLRILAVTSQDRIPLLPNTPTAKEQGMDIDVVMWRGVAVPKGTPADVVAKLEKAIRETVASPEFAEAGKNIGFAPAFLAAKPFDALIVEDDLRIGKLINELGMAKKN